MNGMKGKKNERKVLLGTYIDTESCVNHFLCLQRKVFQLTLPSNMLIHTTTIIMITRINIATTVTNFFIPSLPFYYSLASRCLLISARTFSYLIFFFLSFFPFFSSYRSYFIQLLFLFIAFCFVFRSYCCTIIHLNLYFYNAFVILYFLLFTFVCLYFIFLVLPYAFVLNLPSFTYFPSFASPSLLFYSRNNFFIFLLSAFVL